MKKTLLACVTGALLAGAVTAVPANAALFEDSDARRHILDLRDKKADKTALVEMAKQNDELKKEVTRLNGTVEELSQRIAALEESQKAFYDSMDDRLKRVEPKGSSAAPASSAKASADVQEDIAAADTLYKAGEYANARKAYESFLKTYPNSNKAAWAMYQSGNASYMLKDYKAALNSQNAVYRRYPKNQVAPDAMLNASSAQIALKSLDGAKKTLQSLVQKYPKSAAAKQAKERLKALE